MKIEMSYEIKSTDQPAPQPVNYTNQLQKNIAQPPKQQTFETTYRRNIYKPNSQSNRASNKHINRSKFAL